MRYRWDPVYPPGARRTTPSDPSLRASDAERNAVADKLSRHFADGRLDAAEFKERLDRAMGATTRGDLHGLFDDLPRLVDDPGATPARRRRRVVPFLLLVAVVALSAGASFYPLHFPWVLLVLAGLYVWHRSGHTHRHHRHDPAAVPGSSGYDEIG